MNSPFNDIWGSWSMQQIDDAHFYQMGTWKEPHPTKPGIMIRISEVISKLLIVISCRLEALNKQAYAMSEQQCICAEA
jgi:hypothetical protein